MKTTLARVLPLILLAAATDGLPAGDIAQPQSWQADIQIRTLEVTRSRTAVTMRVIVYSENDDEARDARLVVLLPVGVGIERLAPGCAATPGPSMVPSIRATVACDLGPIANRGYHEVALTTSLPPGGPPRKFGVFAYSATPDPVPGNNYAERVVQ